MADFEDARVWVSHFDCYAPQTRDRAWAIRKNLKWTDFGHIVDDQFKVTLGREVDAAKIETNIVSRRYTEKNWPKHWDKKGVSIQEKSIFIELKTNQQTLRPFEPLP